jgi:hypothetical protein
LKEKEEEDEEKKKKKKLKYQDFLLIAEHILFQMILHNARIIRRS